MSRAQCFFDDIESFYKDNPTRRLSPELDFGVHWTFPDMPHRFRATFVVDTGEIYLANQRVGNILLIACQMPTGDEGRAKVELVMSGWGEVCMQPGSLDWLSERIPDEYDPRVLPGYEDVIATALQSIGELLGDEAVAIIKGDGGLMTFPYQNPDAASLN